MTYGDGHVYIYINSERTLCLTTQTNRSGFVTVTGINSVQEVLFWAVSFWRMRYFDFLCVWPDMSYLLLVNVYLLSQLVTITDIYYPSLHINIMLFWNNAIRLLHNDACIIHKEAWWCIMVCISPPLKMKDLDQQGRSGEHYCTFLSTRKLKQARDTTARWKINSLRYS